MGNTSIKGRNRFFSGVAALALSNLFVKVVGLALKIPLREILTDSGMAYYNNAYDIYAWLFTIATTGLPTAISLMIAEDRVKGNRREIKKIFRITMLLLVIIGVLGTSVMLFGAPLFEQAYKIENSALSIMAISPTLLFICIASSLRGYFQGHQNMLPTAISEVIEAVGKMAVGLLLAAYAVGRGCRPFEVAAYATLGLTIGTAAGMLSLIIRKIFFHPDRAADEYSSLVDDTLPIRSSKRILWTLVCIAVPITISSSVLSFSAVVDGIVLSRRLQQIGFSEEAVSKIIGNYKTCAVPLANLPPALVAPITSSIIPMISASVAAKNKNRVKGVMNGALLLTAIIELPCAIGMSVLAEPIVTLFFGRDETVLTYAVPLLRTLALSVFFLGVMTVTCAFLQAHHRSDKPIWSMVVGAVVKVLSLYILVGIPSLNIYGAPIASILGGFAMSAVNLYFIKKYIGFVPNYVKIMIRPLIAAGICGASAILSFRALNMLLPSSYSLFISISIAVIIYVFAVTLTKTLEREDILLLPAGEKLCRILEHLRLLKKV